MAGDDRSSSACLSSPGSRAGRSPCVLQQARGGGRVLRSSATISAHISRAVISGSQPSFSLAPWRDRPAASRPRPGGSSAGRSARSRRPGLTAGARSPLDRRRRCAISSTPSPSKRSVDAQLRRRPGDELAHRVLLAGGDHEILGRRPAAASSTASARSPWRGPSRAARRCCPCRGSPPAPCAMLARPRVILRVTKVSPRRGLSWLNRMPLQAYMP